MRTKNSLYNMLGIVALYAIKTIFVFLGKTCLIKVLGDEYNGINGLFTNIISMLSIAELGIGSAIIYNLYEPVKNGKIENIKSIMKFYKTCYHIIAVIVFMAGLFIMPLVPSITGNVNVNESIYLLYSLFLLDSVASYFLSYKRSILYVYQKNYIISIFDILYVVILQTMQIMIIYATKNFILYLLIGIICRIGENILIHIYANNKYSFLVDKDIKPISKKVRADIIEKVKGLVFHQIGSYVVFGTDNIILSKMISVITVGFYSNYLTIINPLQSILNQLVSSVQASVGDLLVEKDVKKNYSIYCKLQFINFWLYSIVSISVFYLIQDFISIWIGNRYLFAQAVVFCIVLNFWQTGMRNAINVFKTAGGIFYEDRWVPILESIINIVASVVFTYYFGISGVFIGTFLSSGCLFFYSYPCLVYKPLFQRTIGMYYKEMVIFVARWLAAFTVTGIAVKIYENYICILNIYVNFAVKIIYVFCIANLCMLFMMIRSDELKWTMKKIQYFIHR